ncbi:conserved hypothetical protein [Vibrio crassostreae]|uniref:hypothetical protein n=1 Tax=Vibrio crassostreae TaxID=246167 RepID=UPI0005E0E6CC|nr:hypothetical protein [Vibrio crassostreae]TCW03873.1 hypothetical protein EDB49_11339 [Vibrio crassostreae]CAK2047958.1 conserved hypothetical protein [Vibrio crassostreae]CAK2064437.1 conserved hypothetical protein [Vibrio crassostreae]CAK2097102.1 conserved hypothetical protein [Vibrio crassostreae]CAK2102111.1 conserved hypothetical protein [Vibrio crassostreae]
MKIEVLEDPYYEGSISHETGPFKKWLKVKHPEVELVVPEKKSKFDLHDYTLVMPLVNLATDMSLVNYLTLVLEYTNYCFKGSLKSDSNEVSINVRYENENTGEKKEFNFKGSETALKESIKKFDVNKFMENA